MQGGKDYEAEAENPEAEGNKKAPSGKVEQEALSRREKKMRNVNWFAIGCIVGSALLWGLIIYLFA